MRRSRAKSPHGRKTRVRLTKACLALPEATESSHGQHSAFLVRSKKFAYYLDDHLFTAGASMEADGHVEKGRDAIVAFLPTVLEGVVTTHHVDTPEMTITGSDTATGIWAMFDYLTSPAMACRRA